MKKHGNGCLYFSNNTKYIGEFKNGYIEGKGAFYEGEILVQEGEWDKGKLVKTNIW